MKKTLLVLSIIVMLFAFVACKNEPANEPIEAGSPKLLSIDFRKYDAFAVMRESDGSKGIGDGISGSLNRLFGLAENALEKIKISDEKGLEWACNDVRNIGKNFLLMGLSCTTEEETKYKNYIVDRNGDKIIDLSFLYGDSYVNIKSLCLQTTAEGLFAKKDYKAVKIDAETKTMTSLTNPETDAVSGFYRFDNGIMLVRTSDYKNKFYPKDGVPIECKDEFAKITIYGAVAGIPKSCLTSPELDFLVNLEHCKIARITETGLLIENLDKQYSNFPYYSSTQLYPDKYEGAQDLKKAIFYDGDTLGKVAVVDISTGSFEYKEHSAPKGLGKKNVAYNDGHLIYLTSSGLYSLDLENQTTETLVEGSLAKWQMTTGGVIYTKYLTATDVETCFLNLATKETETLSSSGVEVVSIASFVD